MTITEWVAHNKYEMVAGAVIASVDGKRQYVYRDGEFTPVGRRMFHEWQEKSVPQQVQRPTLSLPKSRAKGKA